MLKNLLIGRIEEKKILEKALESPKAEMVSVIVKRRVSHCRIVCDFPDYYDASVLFLHYKIQ